MVQHQNLEFCGRLLADVAAEDMRGGLKIHLLHCLEVEARPFAAKGDPERSLRTSACALEHRFALPKLRVVLSCNTLEETAG